MKKNEHLILLILFLFLTGISFAQDKFGDKNKKIDQLMNLCHQYRMFSGSVLVGKQGNIIYTFVVVPFLILVFALTLILGVYLYDTIRDETDIFDHNNDSLEIKAAMNTFTDMFSYIFVMYIAAFFVVMALAGYYIDSAPVFLILGIIMLIVAVLISVPIANLYESVIEDGSLAPTASEYGIMNTLMANFPMVITFLGGLFLIVLYGKKTKFT